MKHKMNEGIIYVYVITSNCVYRNIYTHNNYKCEFIDIALQKQPNSEQKRSLKILIYNTIHIQSRPSHWH